MGRRCQWHVDREHAALTRLALYPNVAAVQAREAAREREAKAGALLLPVDAGVNLLEFMEDARLVGDRDADARIGDGHLDRIGEALACDPHQPARGRELDRVGDEV